MSDAGPSTSAGSSSTSAAGSSSQSDRLARLRELHLKRNEARKLNQKEVKEEDKRKNLPSNWEAKRKRLEWEEEQDIVRKEAEAAGEDYERVRLLEVQADDAEKRERNKKQKVNKDRGFSDFEQATFRQYKRLTKQLKPDPTEYMQEKQKMGEAFYPTTNTLGVSEHKDSQDAIDRMVKDLDKQVEKRSKYSRRRIHNPDSDIDYINERNMKFNQKLERFYGKYTSEIKQNLERGTAI